MQRPGLKVSPACEFAANAASKYMNETSELVYEFYITILTLTNLSLSFPVFFLFYKTILTFKKPSEPGGSFKHPSCHFSATWNA